MFNQERGNVSLSQVVFTCALYSHEENNSLARQRTLLEKRVGLWLKKKVVIFWWPHKLKINKKTKKKIVHRNSSTPTPKNGTWSSVIECEFIFSLLFILISVRKFNIPKRINAKRHSSKSGRQSRVNSRLPQIDKSCRS